MGQVVGGGILCWGLFVHFVQGILCRAGVLRGRMGRGILYVGDSEWSRRSVMTNRSKLTRSQRRLRVVSAVGRRPLRGVAAAEAGYDHILH